MADTATPNLPSRDFATTSAFFARLGFTTGFPRLHQPRPEPSGPRIGALIDPDGTLLRLVGNP